MISEQNVCSWALLAKYLTARAVVRPLPAEAPRRGFPTRFPAPSRATGLHRQASARRSRSGGHGVAQGAHLRRDPRPRRPRHGRGRNARGAGHGRGAGSDDAAGCAHSWHCPQPEPRHRRVNADSRWDRGTAGSGGGGAIPDIVRIGDRVADSSRSTSPI